MENHNISGIIVMSIFIEAIITYIEQIFQNGNICLEMIFSIILGIIISIVYSFDIPAQFNLKSSTPYIGNIITGFIISRGSNYIYDILSRVSIYS